MTCARWECKNEAGFYPKIKAKGFDSEGITFKIPFCVSCTEELGLTDMVFTGNFFIIEGALRDQGKNVMSYEDLELEWMKI